MIKHINKVIVARQFGKKFISRSKKQTINYVAPEIPQLEKHALGKYPYVQIQQLSSLHQSIKQFVGELPMQIQMSKNSPLSFLALFARSCLIANKYVPYSSYYPTIKKIINSRQNHDDLTPFSCTALTECFSYFKYEGDQAKIIQKLCDYYAHNYCLFTQQEESAFWEFYIRIMAKKTHHNVKFVKLDRRKQKTIEFASTKEIVTKIVDTKSVNKKIIKNIQYQNDEVFITLVKPTKPNTTENPLQIIVRVKGLVNYNEYVQSKKGNKLDVDLWSKIMEECKVLNTNVSKGWNVIFHGRLEKYWGGEQKYRYSNKDELGQELQYIRSEKIEQLGNITEQDLNVGQKLSNLRLSPRYHNGVFYNSTNPNKRLIDSIPTLMLSVSPKLLEKSAIKFYQQNSLQSAGYLSQYLTIPQLEQVYGYTKICQSHKNLYDAYRPLQFMLHELYEKDKQEAYHIDSLKNTIEEEQLDEKQTKELIAENSYILAELAVNETKFVGHVDFNGGYDKAWSSIHSFRGNYAGEMYWQFKPFFPDVLRIMDEIEQLAQKAIQKNQKNVKVKLVTSKTNLPHIVKHLIEAKYWRVPKLSQKNKEQQQIKQKILSQLIKRN